MSTLTVSLDALVRRIKAREKSAEREVRSRCQMLRDRMIRMDNAGKRVDVDDYVCDINTFGLNHLSTWFNAHVEQTAACDLIALLAENGVISFKVAEQITQQYADALAERWNLAFVGAK